MIKLLLNLIQRLELVLDVPVDFLHALDFSLLHLVFLSILEILIRILLLSLLTQFTLGNLQSRHSFAIVGSRLASLLEFLFFKELLVLFLCVLCSKLSSCFLDTRIILI